MALLRLPTELLTQICSQLTCADVRALSCASRDSARTFPAFHASHSTSALQAQVEKTLGLISCWPRCYDTATGPAQGPEPDAVAVVRNLAPAMYALDELSLACERSRVEAGWESRAAAVRLCFQLLALRANACDGMRAQVANALAELRAAPGPGPGRRDDVEGAAATEAAWRRVTQYRAYMNERKGSLGGGLDFAPTLPSLLTDFTEGDAVKWLEFFEEQSKRLYRVEVRSCVELVGRLESTCEKHFARGELCMLNRREVGEVMASFVVWAVRARSCRPETQ